MARSGKDNPLERVPTAVDRRSILEASDWQSALIDLSHEPILVWDWEEGIIKWNTGAERLYGFERAEVLGKSSHDVLATKHPVSLRRFLKKLEADSYWAGEVRHITKDGRELVVESRQQVVELHGRRIVLESNRDITDRRAGEGQVALLIIIGELIDDLNNPSELLFAVSKSVGQYFKARRCLFNEIFLEKDLEIVRRDYCRRGVGSVAGEHKISAYSAITSEEMKAGRTVVNADSKMDPRTADLYERTYEPAGDRSYVAVPLMRDGEWKASLWICDDQPREWSQADITLLEMVGQRVWLAVEKRRSEVELRRLVEFDEAVMSNMGEGLYTVDAEGRVTSMNPAAERILGWTFHELRGRRMHDVTHHHHRDGTPFPAEECAGFKVLTDGTPLTNQEDVFIRKDGTFVDVVYSSSPLRAPNGEIIGLVVVFRDITERKKAEGLLERYRLLSETSGDMIWFTRPDGSFVDINRAAVETYGYTRDEFLSMNVRDLRHPSELREFQVQLDAAGIGEAHFETVHISKNGTAIPVEVMANSSDFGGERLIMSIVRDITGRKRADEALRKSEELFSRFMEYLPGLAWVKDLEGRYIYANDATERAFGVSQKDLYGKTDDQVFIAETAAQFKQNDQRTLEQGTGLQTIETLEQDDGLLHHSIVSKFPILDADGRIGHIGGIAIDITDRIQAEAALRESEERRQLAQEAGNVGVFDWDIIAGKTYWSETMWSFYGDEPADQNPDEEFWSAHLHENDRDRVKLNIRSVLDSNDNEFRDEFRIVRSDGSIRWLEARAKVSRDGSGTATRMYGVNTDITTRKEAEEKVRLSDNQLRLVTNAVPALISYVDKKEKYRFANERFTDWFGIPTDEIIGKGPLDIFGPEAYRVLKPKIDDVLSGKKCTFETVLKYKGVGDMYVHVSYIPDIGADGTIHGYYGLTQDLTDLKRSQDLLRSSEERMGLLTDSFTDYAVFSMDKDGRIDSWNKGAEVIYGYSQDEVLGRFYEFIFTSEDIARKVPLQEMRNARRKGRASYEGWRLKKDGSRFYSSAVMMPLYVGKTLTGYAKIGSDLTEKKRHAEELQRAHSELEVRVKERTKELAESNAALMQEMQEREIAEKHRIDLLRRLVSSQEFERRRIARDLHDQLGQRLTALRLKLASLGEVSVGDEHFFPRVQRLQEIAERLDSEVSFLAWELRPTALDDLGLMDAVAAFVNEWSRHYEISTDFHAAGLSKERLDREIETHLYRITQEALNNIAKHANAKHVTVLLEKREQNVILIVEDNGKGFDTGKKRVSNKSGEGLGLVGMGERAALVGGDIEIESAPGKGTTIYVRVPFSI